jgi:hypothetical protein
VVDPQRLLDANCECGRVLSPIHLDVRAVDELPAAVIGRRKSPDVRRGGFFAPASAAPADALSPQALATGRSSEALAHHLHLGTS